MQFYANGKIVDLWQRNKGNMLFIKAVIKKDSEEERKLEIGDPIFLYMLAGGNELKVC